VGTQLFSGRRAFVAGGLGTALIAGLVLAVVAAHDLKASHPGHACGGPACGFCEEEPPFEGHGPWYWQRSEDEEKRVASGLFNRYCIRCHGGDGRGIWDIPDVPNFKNAVWQASRSDAQRARIILEGRGAIMPAFRGTLTLEEAWAIGRYLRTFAPGAEGSRPKAGPAKGAESEPARLPPPK
jgi:hypothetical protein